MNLPFIANFATQPIQLTSILRSLFVPEEYLSAPTFSSSLHGGNMLFYRMAARVAAASLIMLTMSAFALADTIRLKDGSIIKGSIVSFGSGKFVVVMGEGSRRRELTFLAGEIESIQFDLQAGSTSVSTVNQNASYQQNPEPPTKVVSNSPVRTGPSSGEKMKPIEWRVKVLADSTANGWTNTGWVVKKGQRIRISGDGKVLLGKGKSSPPAGVPSIADEQKLLKNVATGALVAVIGDDNNDFIYIGAEREFVATRDGALFLGINEGNLDDNSGHFTANVQIMPDSE